MEANDLENVERSVLPRFEFVDPNQTFFPDPVIALSIWVLVGRTVFEDLLNLHPFDLTLHVYVLDGHSFLGVPSGVNGRQYGRSIYVFHKRNLAPSGSF